MYLRANTAAAAREVRTCSNCDRPATLEAEEGLDSGPAIYSCLTCGQREEVSWRVVPPRVVEDIEVIEESHVILGES